MHAKDCGLFYLHYPQISYQLEEQPHKTENELLVNHVLVLNCHLGRLVGLSHMELLVMEFGSSNPEGFLFFSLFLSFFP